MTHFLPCLNNIHPYNPSLSTLWVRQEGKQEEEPLYPGHLHPAITLPLTFTFTEITAVLKDKRDGAGWSTRMDTCPPHQGPGSDPRTPIKSISSLSVTSTYIDRLPKEPQCQKKKKKPSIEITFFLMCFFSFMLALFFSKIFCWGN